MQIAATHLSSSIGVKPRNPNYAADLTIGSVQESIHEERTIDDVNEEDFDASWDLQERA